MVLIRKLQPETGWKSQMMNILRNNFIYGARKILLMSFLIIIILWALISISVPILEEFLIINKPMPHADALVVMAGSMSERLPPAALLYKEGRAPKILLTNDGLFSAYSKEKHRNLYQVEWAEYELLKMQIPGNAIVKLPHTINGTIYDALNTRKAVLDSGIKSIIIVTSDYHTRRSLWTFDRVFKGYAINIGVYPVESNLQTIPFFKKTIMLNFEMLKYIYYKFAYRSI